MASTDSRTGLNAGRIPGPLYFITMDNGPMGHLEQVELACKSGVRWIQLRMKHASDALFAATAMDALAVCLRSGCRLILNDRVAIAQTLIGRGLAGVHVGLEDMPVAEVRRLLGDECIIGGTANTLGDIRRHAMQGADYVGVGPYRYTMTKEKLSPLLGLEGYSRILGGMRAEGIGLPLIAIGGIVRDDIPGLMEAGVYGVAFSGMLLGATDREKLVGELDEMIKN